MGFTMRSMGQQRSIFDGNIPLKINKPLRLIELFAGIGAQAKALENLGVPFEHYRICEFDKYAVVSYNAIHGTNFEPSDITKIHARDLGVVDTERYFYIMTYSFPCTDLSKAGKQQGMSKESGTRSGLLWEVERILLEIVQEGGIYRNYSLWRMCLMSLAIKTKTTSLRGVDSSKAWDIRANTT